MCIYVFTVGTRKLKSFEKHRIRLRGRPHLFNNDGLKWHLCLSDAAQAFLQGKQNSSERDGPIYMEFR